MKLKIGVSGKMYEIEVEVLEDDGAPRMPPYGSYPVVPSTVQSAAAPVSSTPAPVDEEGSVPENKACRSPVAGVVITVNVQPGQQIETNDLLIVLEAMKMETNVTAPGAGKVKNVRMAQGDPVKVNQIVVEFE